jgi:predicted nucleotide-binding protein
MARQRSTKGTQTPPTEPPHLLVPREQFESELVERIEAGRVLADAPLDNRAVLEAAQADYYTWNEYNQELLKRRFTNSTIADEYSDWIGIAFSGRSFPEEVSDHREDVQRKLRRLDSIRKRIPLFEEAAVATAGKSAKRGPATISAAETIFVVHGRNEAAKLGVQGFLRDVTSLDPVILHLQRNVGRTLIEKFEEEGADAAFAVVILTADDVGRANDEKDLHPRGRQNVVFEFGYFVSAIGRSRTAVLYEEGVELPSDIDGLVYIPYDPAGAWKLLLGRELKAAGIKVDANRLL